MRAVDSSLNIFPFKRAPGIVATAQNVIVDRREIPLARPHLVSIAAADQ